ncbi:4-hydroxybenzoyl-CoA thioesterase [Spirochaetia bacterium]|nr:4-hydroxybenzoyl-CoA thioesterase [Spirochaetia bacterium]
MQTTISAEIEFTVEFYDVDSMEIVYHGNYIKYFEKARCALLNKIGYDYLAMKDSGWAFPVTGISARYISSLSFQDRVRARAILTEYENCIRIKYELYNAKTGQLCTKGESTQMAIDMAAGESRIVCPAIFTDKVEALLRQADEAAK